MANFTLTEGNLSFLFDDVESADKYDDWVHYRGKFQKACGGSKAVDFLVSKSNEVWLIEVKDYRYHRRTKSLDLADEVAEKVRDTLAGLVSAKFLADDPEATVSKKSLSKRKLRVALHLEQPKNPSRLFPVSINIANIKTKLRQKIRFADLHVEVFHCDSFPPHLGKVTSI